MWRHKARSALPAVLMVALLGACANPDMTDQERYDPLEPSEFFADGRSARVPPEGAVARGSPRRDEWMFPPQAVAEPWRGAASVRLGAESNGFPLPLTPELLARGRERFAIYCAPCHGAYGGGEGVVTRLGFPPPPTLHQDRLRDAPHGHYFQVITDGFGRMLPYAYRVPPEDRWAIIAFIRALQLSRHVPASDLPEADRARLEGP